MPNAQYAEFRTQLLTLDSQTRSALAADLLASLDGDDDDSDSDHDIWEADIADRIAAIRAGTPKTTDLATFLVRLHAATSIQ